MNVSLHILENLSTDDLSIFFTFVSMTTQATDIKFATRSSSSMVIVDNVQN